MAFTEDYHQIAGDDLRITVDQYTFSRPYYTGYVRFLGNIQITHFVLGDLLSSLA